MVTSSSENQNITRSNGSYYLSSISSSNQIRQKKVAEKADQRDSLGKGKTSEKSGKSLERPQLPPGQSKNPAYFTLLATAFAELETAASQSTSSQISDLTKLTQLDDSTLQGTLQSLHLDMLQEQSQVKQIDKEEKAKKAHKKKNWFKKATSTVGNELMKGITTIGNGLSTVLSPIGNAMDKVPGLSQIGKAISYITITAALITYYEGANIVNGHPERIFTDAYTGAKNIAHPTQANRNSSKQASSSDDKKNSAPVTSSEGKKQQLSFLLMEGAITENNAKQKEQTEEMANKKDTDSLDSNSSKGSDGSSKKGSGTELLNVILNAHSRIPNAYMQISQGLANAV